MAFLFLIALIVPTVSTLNLDQVRGFRKLIKGLDKGVIATCDIVFFTEPVRYEEAEVNCKDFTHGLGHGEGNLATIDSDQKNTDIKLLLDLAYPLSTVKDLPKFSSERWAWFGLRKVRHNGYDGEVKEGLHREDWQWSDGTNIESYDRFARKQPDQKPLKVGVSGCDESPKCYQNQVRVNHAGLWDDTFKYKKHPYACDYKGKYIISATKMSWNKAKQACNDAGLNFATVSSMEDLNDLKHAAIHFLGQPKEDAPKWDVDSWYWIGGTDMENEGDWKWIETNEMIDSKADYIPWGKNQPDNMKRYGKYQNYLRISLKGRFDDSFEHKKHPFACECPRSG